MKIKYKNVSVEMELIVDGEEAEIKYMNPNNGQWVERPSQICTGWSFQDEETNEDMKTLIDFLSEADLLELDNEYTYKLTTWENSEGIEFHELESLGVI